MNNYLIVIVVAAFVIVSALWVVNVRTANAPSPKACTMEAKICPDGSAVGRTGPNCEFAKCPTVNDTGTAGGGGGGGGSGSGSILPYKSGVRGTVLLGPTCPVMREPPDPQCADKPYATTINVLRAGSSQTFATGQSDANGSFEFSLPPGSYTLSASGGKTLPRCSPVDVAVGPTGYVTAPISCDTGIR